LFVILSPSSLAPEDEDAKEQQTQFRASELYVLRMDSMGGKRERRGGGREREREKKREREEGGGMFGKGRAGKRFATRSTETAVLQSAKVISN
jgi:hypothetical protein